MSIMVPCSITEPHEPHFYASFIAGGPPGPVPKLDCLCPGKS